MEKAWKLVDESTPNRPAHIDLHLDVCFYAHEYKSEGYKATPTNSMVCNFKKPPDRRGTREWEYKQQAIQTFCNEVADLLEKNSSILNRVYFSWIPGSYTCYESQYDDRFEQLFECIRTKVNGFNGGPLLRVYRTAQPSHLGGSRDPAILMRNLSAIPIDDFMWETVVLIDDVLTSRAHYCACKQIVLNAFPSVRRVCGLFWAKTIS